MNTMQRMLAALLLTTSARQIEEGPRARVANHLHARDIQFTEVHDGLPAVAAAEEGLVP